jgi:hypothetical protein
MRSYGKYIRESGPLQPPARRRGFAVVVCRVRRRITGGDPLGAIVVAGIWIVFRDRRDLGGVADPPLAVIEYPIAIIVQVVFAQVEGHGGGGIDHQHQIQRGGLRDGVGLNGDRIPTDDRQEGKKHRELRLHPHEFPRVVWTGRRVGAARAQVGVIIDRAGGV